MTVVSVTIDVTVAISNTVTTSMSVGPTLSVTMSTGDESSKHKSSQSVEGVSSLSCVSDESTEHDSSHSIGDDVSPLSCTVTVTGMVIVVTLNSASGVQYSVHSAIVSVVDEELGTISVDIVQAPAEEEL